MIALNSLRKLAAGLWLPAAFFLLAACSSPAPVATRTPAAFPTLAGTPLPATLPPTWTPTFTPSPLPPSATPTPTRVPSATPTRSAADWCEQFRLLYEIPPLQVFRTDAIIPFVADIPAGATMRFLAVHRRTGENQGVELLGGQSYLFEFPVNLLPRVGLYDWTLALITPDAAELCPRSGRFIVLDATPD